MIRNGVECPGPECPSCNGERCDLCDATQGHPPYNPPCQHDVVERHADDEPRDSIEEHGLL